MYNYLTKFVQNDSAKSHSLRELLKDGVTFNWDDEQQKEFKNMKKSVCNNTCAIHRTPKKEPLINTPFPDLPWSTVGCDFLTEKANFISFCKITTQGF